MDRRRHTLDRRSAQSPLAKLVEGGPYFTDAVRLFRLAAVVPGSNGPKLVQLEDCRTLQVSGYTAEEVALLELVPVSTCSAARDAESRGSASNARDSEHGRRARAHQS